MSHSEIWLILLVVATVVDLVWTVINVQSSLEVARRLRDADQLRREALQFSEEIHADLFTTCSECGRIIQGYCPACANSVPSN